MNFRYSYIKGIIKHVRYTKLVGARVYIEYVLIETEDRIGSLAVILSHQVAKVKNITYVTNNIKLLYNIIC